MAGTSFTKIFDVFMVLQQDYNLVILYNQSETDFTTYLEGWLILSVDEFNRNTKPTQSLGYDLVTQTFNETLSDENQLVLSRVMVRYWMERVRNDIRQMNLSIQDHDFKHYAESQNLKEKINLLTVKIEELSQLYVDYGYKHNDWDAWANGNFNGG